MQRCNPSDWEEEDAAVMQRRGWFTPHACAASGCQGAIIGGLSLCMICVYNPPLSNASGFHLHSPVHKQKKGYREAAGLPIPHVSQWAHAASPLLPSPWFSLTFLCSLSVSRSLRYSDMWMSVHCLYTPTISLHVLFSLLSDGCWNYIIPWEVIFYLESLTHFLTKPCRKVTISGQCLIRIGFFVAYKM